MLDASLRHYWHPAATSAELKDQPLAATLLDERIVLWRAGGRAVAFKDLCIHRGSALSLGGEDHPDPRLRRTPAKIDEVLDLHRQVAEL
jgi:phenylpropionate dioxygenase-like ring-hydroxylating dioxygenase large terminal subunit